MKKNLLSLLLIILFGCGGGDANVGGGGQSIASTTSPALYYVFLSPPEVSLADRTPLFVRIDVFDAGGDLNGGAFYFRVNGFEDHRPLPDSLAGVTTRTTVPLPFPITTNSQALGTIRMDCFVKDRRGFSSNIVTVSVTQNP